MKKSVKILRNPILKGALLIALSTALVLGAAPFPMFNKTVYAADHVLYGGTVEHIINYIHSVPIQEGDIVYLGANNYSYPGFNEYDFKSLDINQSGFILNGGSPDNPNGYSTFSDNGCRINVNEADVSLLNMNWIGKIYVDDKNVSLNNISIFPFMNIRNNLFCLFK